MDILASQAAAAVGLALSAYSAYIERRIEKDENYSPICELGANASCKAAFRSEYGRTFGISNSIIGILAYSSYLMITILYPQYLIYPATVALITSLALGFISYVKMKNICIICTIIYLINIILFISAAV